MNILEKLKDRVKANPQRIVLPEGTEIRTLKAANAILKEEVAHLILLGDEQEIKHLAQQNELTHISKATCINPNHYAKSALYAEQLYELRKTKGLTKKDALELVKNPLYMACMMIKNNDADGELAGARNTTGDVLRPAFQIIKTKPGIKVVSGALLMFTQAKEYGEAGLLLFADCAVNPNPTAEELANIALSTAETARSLAKIEPHVAMLSFSTKGSAKHELADKVIAATTIAKQQAPELQIDGELQADAALVPKVGQSKAPNSPVAGRANVLVFPDLQAANIGYKLVERLGGAKAIGPVLQGIAAPINDLSRGCSTEDIEQMIIITSALAIKD